MSKQKIIAGLIEHYTSFFNTQELTAKRKDLAIHLVNVLLEPVITPKGLNITYATIKYWESKNYLLFPVLKEAGEWRKFTMLEHLWVKIIIKLTEMGCALDVVMPKIIYAYTHHKNPNDIMVYEPATATGTDNINTEQVLHFFTHIFSMVERKGKFTLHLFDDDTILFAAESGRKQTEVINAAYQTAYKTGITICISDLVYEHSSNTKLGQQLQPQAFGKQEAQILTLLRNKELKELTIKLENGKPVHFELTEQFDITKDDASKRLAEFLNSPYQEINAVTNGGKTIAIKRVTKQKTQ